MENEKSVYYKLAPAILIVGLLVFAYLAVSFVEREVTKTAHESGILTVFDDVMETVDEVKRIVETFQNMSSGYNETFQREKPKPGKLSDTTRIIADFSSPQKTFTVSILNSKGAIGTFVADKEAGDAASPIVMRLDVQKFGPPSGAKGYINGKIDFNPPVNVEGAQAIEFRIKGANVKSFGITLMARDGANWFGWDIQKTKVEGEWTVVTAHFVSFNLWHYDVQKRQYNRINKWVAPKLIDSVRVYLQPGHMSGDGPGTLWVDDVALR